MSNSTVIILQDECVLIAEGKSGKKIEIEQVERIPVDVFADPFEQWKEAIAKYKEKHHIERADLVLSTSYSSARVSQIPYARGKALRNMARNMMTTSSAQGSVMDYGIIKSDKKQGSCLCVSGTEEETLSKLKSIAEQLDIAIQSVRVPMECYLNVLAKLKEYKNQIAILLLFEENSVTSILLKQGEHLYSTRSRIFSERGTLDFGTEITRNVSGIMQFYATTKSEVPIEKVYYAGCSKDDFEVTEAGIEAMNLEVAPLHIDVTFPAGKDAAEWLLCIGALYKSKRAINLYSVWMEHADKKHSAKKNGNLLKNIQFPLLTVAICLFAMLFVTIQNNDIKRQIERIESWIYAPDVQLAYTEVLELQNKSDRLISAENQVDLLTANLKTYPDMDMQMVQKIISASGENQIVEIKSLDAVSGVLTFNAVSKEVIDIPGYIERMSMTGLFSEVNYTGYSYANEEYTLMLTCVLEGIETEETGNEN